MNASPEQIKAAQAALVKRHQEFETLWNEILDLHADHLCDISKHSWRSAAEHAAWQVFKRFNPLPPTTP